MVDLWLLPLPEEKTREGRIVHGLEAKLRVPESVAIMAGVRYVYRLASSRHELDGRLGGTIKEAREIRYFQAD